MKKLLAFLFYFFIIPLTLMLMVNGRPNEEVVSFSQINARDNFISASEMVLSQGGFFKRYLAEIDNYPIKVVSIPFRLIFYDVCLENNNFLSTNGKVVPFDVFNDEESGAMSLTINYLDSNIPAAELYRRPGEPIKCEKVNADDKFNIQTLLRDPPPLIEVPVSSIEEATECTVVELTLSTDKSTAQVKNNEGAWWVHLLIYIVIWAPLFLGLRKMWDVV